MDPMRLWNAPTSSAVERERFVERSFGRQRLEQLIATPSSAGESGGGRVGSAELRDLFALDSQVHALSAVLKAEDLPEARAASWTGRYAVALEEAGGSADGTCPVGCCCLQGDVELLDAAADAVLYPSGEPESGGAQSGGSGGGGGSDGRVPPSLQRAVSVRADVGNGVTGQCPGAVHVKDFVPSVHSSARARGPSGGDGGGSGGSSVLQLSVFNQSTSITRVDADTIRFTLHANATRGSRCPSRLARRRLDLSLEHLCFRLGVGGSPLGCLQFHPLAMWAIDPTGEVTNPRPGQFFEAALAADVAKDGERTVQDKLLHWDGWADLFNHGLSPLLTNPWTANSTVLAYNSSNVFNATAVGHAPRGTAANVSALQVWYFLDDSDSRRALYPPGAWRAALSSWESAFARLVATGTPNLHVLVSAEKSYGDEIGAGIVADLPAMGAAMGLTLLAAALLAARTRYEAASVVGGGTGGDEMAPVHASSGAVVGGGGAALVLSAVLAAFGLCQAIAALPAIPGEGGDGDSGVHETSDDGTGMAAPTGSDRVLPNSPFSTYALLLLVALGIWQLLLLSELFARAAATQLATLLGAAARSGSGCSVATEADAANAPASINGAEQVSHQCMRELFLPAGSAANIQWSLEDKDINFSVSFKPTSQAPASGCPLDFSAATTLVPVHRAARGAHRVAPQAVDGVVHMCWDNRFSWLAKKQLVFEVATEVAAAVVVVQTTACTGRRVGNGSDVGGSVGEPVGASPAAATTSSPDHESLGAELYARGSAAVYCTAIFAMAFIMHNMACMQGWVVATLSATAWATAARAERVAAAAAAAGAGTRAPSIFVREPRLALGVARAAAACSAAVFVACIAVGATQQQRLNGSSIWLGSVSNFVAFVWALRCLSLARRQQRRRQQSKKLWAANSASGHDTAGEDGDTEADTGVPAAAAARACLALDAPAPPVLQTFDQHAALDRVAARRALSDAEPVLLSGTAASLLLLLAAAAASSLPAVQAFCVQTAAGVVVLHGTMVWVLPALLQLRWQQLKRQLWWLAPRLKHSGVKIGNSGGGNVQRSHGAARAALLLLAALVLLVLSTRALAVTRLHQSFGREDVLPATSTLHKFFYTQEELFAAVLPMALVSRGVNYSAAAAFKPLTAAHAALSACGAVDPSQGAAGVVDWYSQPGGPSSADPGSTLHPALAAQTPLMTYLLSNDSSSEMPSFCSKWGPFICPIPSDDDEPQQPCAQACTLTTANISGAVGVPALPTNIGPRGAAWPHASVVKLWAVAPPDFFGQAFAQNLDFANASAASTLAITCGPLSNGTMPVACQHGDDSLHTGELRAAKSDLFSRPLADPRDIEEQRAVRDAVWRAVAPAVDTLRAGGDGNGGALADGASASSHADPVFVHSLLFVILEQFDSLREQAKLGLVLGAVAVALAPVLTVVMHRRSARHGFASERPWRSALVLGVAALVAGAMSCADLLGMMSPLYFGIAISSTSANITLFLPVLLCFFAAAACADGSGSNCSVMGEASSPAAVALGMAMCAVLFGALPCLAMASPANKQVATMYVLAALLAALHAAMLGCALRLRRLSASPIDKPSSAPLLTFQAE